MHWKTALHVVGLVLILAGVGAGAYSEQRLIANDTATPVLVNGGLIALVVRAFL